MNKWQGRIMACVISILVLFSCESSNEDVTVGFMVHSLASSRWQMDTEFIKQRVQEQGAKVIVKNANGDENVQLQQVKELLDEGADVIIVVAANQNTAAGIVRDAHARNVKVIAYDRLIRNADLDYLVSFQYQKVGELMVEYALTRKPAGKYVVLWGDASDGNALFVQKAQVDALKPVVNSGQVEIVYQSFVEGWSRENAFFIMKQVLEFSGEKIDAVIASNDPIALGASEALSLYGFDPSEVIITGQDATLAACQAIVQGQQTMTVYKSLKGLAHQAVDLALDVATKRNKIELNSRVNNGRKDVPAILLEPQAVDRDNIRSTVVADGVFTLDEIYKENSTNNRENISNDLLQ